MLKWNISCIAGVSKVLENTAFFGDMILRLPDIVHDFYDREKEWHLLLAWSYGFCLQSEVFDGSSEKLLNLVSGQDAKKYGNYNTMSLICNGRLKWADINLFTWYPIVLSLFRTFIFVFIVTGWQCELLAVPPLIW